MRTWKSPSSSTCGPASSLVDGGLFLGDVFAQRPHPGRRHLPHEGSRHFGLEHAAHGEDLAGLFHGGRGDESAARRLEPDQRFCVSWNRAWRTSVRETPK